MRILNQATESTTHAIQDKRIAIVKDGYDLCRIIPNHPKDGKYNLKITFLGKPFDIDLYKQFAARAKHVVVDSHEDVEISYHIGEKNGLVVIHLKQERNKCPIPYESLDLKHIQAPDTQSFLPVPLFRLELPSFDVIKKTSKTYKPKPDKHHTLDIGEDNVLEFWISGKGYESDFFNNELHELALVQRVMPIEFFAAHNAYILNKKFQFFFRNTPRCCSLKFDYDHDASFMISGYSIPAECISSEGGKYKITFIENSVSNEIFLNSVISKQDLKDGIFQGVSVGLPTYNSLNRPIEIEFTDYNALHSAGEWTLRSNTHNPRFQKDKFLQTYQTARSTYSTRLREHEKAFESKRREIEAKVGVFKQVYNDYTRDVHQNFDELVRRTGEEERLCFQQLDVVSKWFVIAEWCKPIGIYILLAKFLGMNELAVSGWYFSKEGGLPREYLALGSDDILYTSPIGHHSIYHCWMQYDEFFDIDVLCNNLNQLFNDSVFPENLVALSEGPGGIPYPKEFGVSEKINEIPWQIIQVDYVLNREEFDASFVRNHGQLNQVYQMLMTSFGAYRDDV